MAPDDHSGGRPAGPVVLRIKLRYDDLDAMVQRFAPNVGKSGLFLPTRSIQPIGTEVKFELRLANDTAALVGIGRVKHVKPHDPTNPKAAFGMAIELMRVSREGREVIIRMIERRRAMGLPDVAIPVPEDIEAARRAEVDSQPRADTSGIVREAMAQFASAPVAEQVLSSPPPSGPLAVAKEPEPAPKAAPATVAKEPARESSSRMRTPSGPIPVARDDRSSAPLLTSPRTGSGPISRESSKSVPVLAPEPPRAKRPRVAELIAKATELSGPLAAAPIPGLDEHVDVERALSRARMLATGADLDAELAAVRESAAAPVEISIDAASAELARQLGGSPIARRDRSARWAPPPAVETRPEPVAATPDAEFVARTRAETEAGAASVLAAVIDKAVEAAPPPDVAPIHEPAHEEPAPEPEPEPVPEEIAAAPEEPVEQVERDLDADANDDAFAVNASTTTAVDPDVMTQAPSMMIDDAAHSSPFDRAFSEAERLNTGDLQLIEDEDLRENTQIGAMPVDPNAFQAHAYATMPDHGEHQLADQLDRQLDEAEAEADADLAQAMESQPSYDPYANQPAAAADDEEEEISDLDVLAEADEDDADLLTTHGEREASNSGAPAYQDPQHEQQPGYQQQAYAEPGYEQQPQYAEPYAEQQQPYPEQYAEQPPQQYAEQQPYPQQYAEQQPYAEPAAEQAPYQLGPYEPQEQYDEHGYPRQHSQYDEQGLPPAHYQAPEHLDERPSHSDFASRLDLGDDESAEHDIAAVPARRRSSQHSRAPSASEFPDPPSSSYTFAEPFPQAALHLPENEGIGEEFDEPHSYSQQQYRQASDERAPEPTRNLQPTRPPEPQVAQPRMLRQNTDDLEDALAALDVDLDEISPLEQQRARRPSAPQPVPSSSSSAPRPLPGLPIHRPTGPVPTTKPVTRGIAHTVPRAGTKPPTMPPPVPAAALRKPPTQQVPVAPQPKPKPKRPPTDDGVMIDFDDDE